MIMRVFPAALVVAFALAADPAVAGGFRRAGWQSAWRGFANGAPNPPYELAS